MSRELLMAAQIAGAGVWTVSGLLPLARRAFWSPAGWAFALFGASLGAYALADLFYLRSGTGQEALLWVRVRGSLLTIGALCLLFFARWISFKRRKRDLLLTLPTAVLLVLVWTAITPAVTPTDWGFYPLRNLGLYIPWLVYLYGYAIVGIHYLMKGARPMRGEFQVEYIKAVGFVVSIAGALVVGLVGNVIATVSQVQAMPLFGSLLVIPGSLMLIVMLPVTKEGVSDYVRRGIRARGQVLHAFLVYHGGSLIASRSLEHNPAMDEDIFSAVLEAIQKFLRITFPGLASGWLGAIDHGDLKILLERGRYCFLVLVTAGREDDLLRGEMKDVLATFEEKNASMLENWNGDPDELRGAQEAVNVFFDLAKVF